MSPTSPAYESSEYESSTDDEKYKAMTHAEFKLMRTKIMIKIQTSQRRIKMLELKLARLERVRSRFRSKAQSSQGQSSGSGTAQGAVIRAASPKRTKMIKEETQASPTTSYSIQESQSPIQETQREATSQPLRLVPNDQVPPVSHEYRTQGSASRRTASRTGLKGWSQEVQEPQRAASSVQWLSHEPRVVGPSPAGPQVQGTQDDFPRTLGGVYTQKSRCAGRFHDGRYQIRHAGRGSRDFAGGLQGLQAAHGSG